MPETSKKYGRSELSLYKVLNNSRFFLPGQKVWCPSPTGGGAAKMVGRYKGKGRWICVYQRFEDHGEYYNDKPGKTLYGGNASTKFIAKIKVCKCFYRLIDDIYWKSY